MELPELNNSENYKGLYVIDFGDNCAVGYTARETAMLLESEKFADVKVYKIARALPDGTIELSGITNDRFRLESGMFFYCRTADSAVSCFDTLSQYADENASPCPAKLQLAHDTEGNNILGLIYPAEYEEEISQWISASGFKGEGPVDAGVSQVEVFYNSGYCIDKSKQIIAADQVIPARDMDQLLADISLPVQRAM